VDLLEEYWRRRQLIEAMRLLNQTMFFGCARKAIDGLMQSNTVDITENEYERKY